MVYNILKCLVSGVQLTKYGHPRLRVVLKELFGNVKMDDFTYHAQFSSLGSLGAAPGYWLTGQFLNSLSGGSETGLFNIHHIVFERFLLL